MAFTTSEKVRLMEHLADRTLYIALGIGTTEVTGSGYARGASPAENNTVDTSTGVLTIAAGQVVYTANDDSAQDSTHFRVYRSSGGGESDAVTDWTSHNDIEAPGNGRAVETGTITITP